MSYLLEFPPSTLPANICAPPYVVFGLNGTSIVQHLPPRIPLNAVLHFVPKLAQWVLPPPEVVPENVTTPYVGIDICADVGLASIQRIMFKVVQAAGLNVPKNLFMHPPSLITAVSVRKTWLFLELHPAGLDGMTIHTQTLLISGPPVKFSETLALWDNFPSTSDVLRVMAVNYVQSHIALQYSCEEFMAIRNWYLADEARYNLFKMFEEQYPAFGKTEAVQDTQPEDVNNEMVESKRKAKEKEVAEEQAAVEKEMEVAVMKKKSKKSLKKESMEDLLERAESAKDDTTKVAMLLGSTKTKTKTKRRRSADEIKDQAAVEAKMTAALTEALHAIRLEEAEQPSSSSTS